MTIYNKFLNNSLKGLIYLMPLSFIFGNVIINVFVILIGLLGLMYYKKKYLFMANKFKFDDLYAFFLFYYYFPRTITLFLLSRIKMLSKL